VRPGVGLGAAASLLPAVLAFDKTGRAPLGAVRGAASFDASPLIASDRRGSSTDDIRIFDRKSRPTLQWETGSNRRERVLTSFRLEAFPGNDAVYVHMTQRKWRFVVLTNIHFTRYADTYYAETR
jgi:hypothetical protein